MDRISIIVPTFNRVEMLKRLLESFSGLTCTCPLEFIIIDDCSDNDIRTIVEDWKETTGLTSVTYHRLESRSGPARARNTGIALSTGTILAFTDSDCVADPRWAELLYQRLICSPDYAGVGGRVLPLNDDIYSCYHTIYRVLEPPPHLNAVIGANCMFWKQPVVDAGMFDDYFFRPGGEEIALSMKLWIRGFRFGFEDKAVVYHEYRQTLKEFIQTFYNYGIGERIIIKNRLKEYLQYMSYPEKMYGNLAFRFYMLFWMIFILHIFIGSFNQRAFLCSVRVSNKRRLMLFFLHLLHHFTYHLGRGTFSASLVREVRKFGATPSDV
jgi:glycosyltransferase involved in cell wall biosynthesis